MKFDVLTLFPDWFEQFAQLGVIGRAIESKKLELAVWNPRDDALNRYGQVDDRPYGGGPGMVMQYQPLKKTLDRCRQSSDSSAENLAAKPLVVALSPQGDTLNNAWVQRLAAEQHLVLICGRYEGLDERFVEEEVDVEISTGDYVVSGGELPAMLLMDAVARWLPGVLGDQESAIEDSFTAGLLDHPHYTRPELAGENEELAVPDVLLSGNHARIRQWRSEQALMRTWLRRPDLIEGLLDSGGLTQAQQSQVLKLICDLVAERME